MPAGDASSGTTGAWVPAPAPAGTWQCPGTGKTYTFTANASQVGGCSGTPSASSKGYLFRVQYGPGNAAGCGCSGSPYGGGAFSTPLCIGVEQCSCENTFSAVLTCGDPKTLVVTFTSKDAGPIVIQGGLTNGTTIVDATCSNGTLTRNLTHPSVLNSEANVTRWEGNMEAFTPLLV